MGQGEREKHRTGVSEEGVTVEREQGVVRLKEEGFLAGVREQGAGQGQRRRV